MNFEWDERTDAHNLAKHGVAFIGAATIFSDPLSITFPDPDHSVSEDRFITIGMSDRKRLLIVSHTEDDDTLRIISARPTTTRERKLYESGA